MKQILNRTELDQELDQAIDLIANVVKTTLGPGGRNIILERQGQATDGTPLAPRITKDGVSVARECYDSNPTINSIMQVVKETCKKTNADAGDGTTTAITLAQAIYHSAKNVIEKEGYNPQTIKTEIEVTMREVLEQLDSLAQPVTKEMISEVATLSANGDVEAGNAIAEAFDHVGVEGVVVIDEGIGLGLSINKVDGYQFDRGVVRDNLFNNESRTAFEITSDYETEAESGVAVVVYDGPVKSMNDIIPVLKLLAGANEEGQATNPMPPVLFIANEFSLDVINFMIIQRADQGFEFCAVKGPHTTNVRSGYYEDIAYYTGGTALGNGKRGLRDATLDDVGYVKRVVSNSRTTTLYDGAGDEDAVLERVSQLKVQKEGAPSPYDESVFADRIAAITSGVAKIGVGGATDIEIKERYDRIEDALNAARSAIEEGVIAGGGSTLLRIANELGRKDEPTVGDRIMVDSISAPFVQILNNIGIEDVADIEGDLLDNANSVYDSRNLEIIDCWEAGILDPVKVTKKALENAVSIAGLLITAGGAVVLKGAQ